MKASRIARHLRKARATIQTPDRWTQGAYARTHEEKDCLPNDPKAASFCMVGALDRALGICTTSVEDTREMEVLMQALQKTYSNFDAGLCYFNDNGERNHSEVLDVYDEAIRIAEGRVAA